MPQAHDLPSPRRTTGIAHRAGGWAWLVLIAALRLGVPEWKIDPKATIAFSTRSAVGTFTGLAGKVVFDPNKLPESHLELELDAATIQTGNALKNKHARGSDWLDVERYPKIRFSSTRFRRSDQMILVEGMLELHGVRKAVIIPFTYETGDAQMICRGRFSVDRGEYGIEGNWLAFVVGSRITIEFVLPMQRLP